MRWYSSGVIAEASLMLTCTLAPLAPGNRTHTPTPALTTRTLCAYLPPTELARRTGAFLFARRLAPRARQTGRVETMKIKNSLKSLKARDRNNRVVRRKGRVYVINKQNPRYKARQG